MERTYINEAQKAIGGTVKVQGFIENLRNSKYMAFIVLKDITGKLQITVEKEDHPDLVDTIDQLTPDSVITVTGKVMENDYVKMGGIEIIPESIEIESIADCCYGVAKILIRKQESRVKFNEEIYTNVDSMFIDVEAAMANMLLLLSDVENVHEKDIINSYNLEREINNLRNQLRTANVENINERHYEYQAGIYYMDIIGSLEKTGDYIINVVDEIKNQFRKANS